MKTEQPEQVVEIISAALDLAPDQRAAFLDEACRDDASLRAEVESLLGYQAQARSFIEAPAFQAAADLIAANDDELETGQLLGGYKILKVIGKGGMGEVYLAEDSALNRKVALKLVKRGMNSVDVLRRFHYEERILANLNHTHIAKLFGSGMTPEGQPYFVMEYVDGLPIDKYCDAHKLSTIERLTIFRQVCSAVDYAHQHLVIHRDIKPANILVTNEGEPKLLDFGISKLLDPELPQSGEEHATVTLLGVMTPEYASPEQARGESVTTATDVYSLGVLLYQLLTGHRPYRLKSRRPEEIVRVICEEEPERPSTAVTRSEERFATKDNPATTITPASVSETRQGQPAELRRKLSGDLDNIVLMALRKDPQRRYNSIAQFSADIKRHLDGLPVIARKDTFTYRSTKFIQRNKIGVAAAMLVAVSLLIGMTVSILQTRKAHVEAAKAGRVSAFMRDIFLLANQRFNSPGRNLKGGKMTAVDMLDEASKRIDTELADQPDVRAQLHHTIGDTYLTFNRFDAAEQHFRLALALSREVYGERNPKAANELYHLAATLGHKDEMSEAEQLYRQAIAMMRQTDAEHANLPHMLHDYAGLRLLEYGDVETAEPLLRESLALFKRKYGEEYVMVVSLNNGLAVVAEARNELDKAEAMYRDSLAGFSRLSASTDQNNRQFINWININLARVALKKGHYAEAETMLRGVLDGMDESSPDYDGLTLICDALLAQLHYRTGEYDKAEAERRRGLEIEQSILRADHRRLIPTLCKLSEVLSKEGKTKEAVSRYDEARAIYDRRAGDALKDAELKGMLGECLIAQRRYNEAEPLLTESYPALDSRLGQSNSLTIEAKRRLVSLYEAWNKPEQAAQYRTLI